MSDGRFDRVERLFEEASGLAPDERGSFLAKQCAGDADLKAEVESLLAAEERAGEFLQTPVVEHGMQAASQPPGRKIGSYELLRKSGEGGMSEVYLAVRADDEFQKRVAVKIIRHGDDREGLLRRFRVERQILAGLDHPNIAKLLDGGTTDDGLPYFVMDYIDGVRIDEYCDEHRLSIRERLELFCSVCSAVQYAHQNLIIHRDIKPTNILVTADGVPKLLDFGIAKLLKPDALGSQAEYTATWARPMTPRYASPEQLQGRPVTTTSDVYSLGVLLYVLLAGHLPYGSAVTDPASLSRKVLETDPERPSTAVDRSEPTGEGEGTITPESVSRARRAQPLALRRQLSGDLDNIVLMALRKEPQRRYASSQQLSEDLRRYLEGLPVAARKDTLSYRTTKFMRRNRWPVAAAVLFVGMLAAFAINMSLQAQRSAIQRDEARRAQERAEQVVFLLQGLFEHSDPLQVGGEVSARAVLDRGAEQVERDLGDQPETQAALREAIGKVYANLSLYEQATPLLRRALQQRRSILGERHVEVAASLHALGSMLRQQGGFDEAEPLLLEALEIRQAALQPDHPDVAESLYALALLRQDRSEPEESERLFREAIVAQNAAGGGRQLAAMKSDLAVLVSEMGRFDDAETLFREVLELRRTLLGSDHLLVAESMNDLGVLFGMQGKFAECEPLFRDALQIRRAGLGNEHPAIAESLNNLGRLLKEMGRLEEAEQQYREGLRVERARRGDDHPRVAILRANLSALLQQQGKLDEAERMARHALATRRRVLGPDKAEVGYSLVGLGAIVLEAERPAEAEALFRDGLAIYESELPTDHWRAFQTRSLLGGALAALGREAEAEPLLIAGYERLLEGRGPAHRTTRQALDRLIDFYKAAGRAAEAESYRNIRSAAE